MFSCEFCEISKNIFFTEYLRWLLLEVMWWYNPSTKYRIWKSCIYIDFFFYQGFLSQTLTIHRTAGDSTSTLSLPPAHKNWDIYLQFCMWYDFHDFHIIPTLLFTRPLLDEIDQLIELPFDWLIDWWHNVCLFIWWFDCRLSLNNLTRENGGFELASAIILVLQAYRLIWWKSNKVSTLLTSTNKSIAWNSEQGCEKISKVRKSTGGYNIRSLKLIIISVKELK